MKRAGNLLPAIAEPANLELAFWKAALGKAARPEVVAWRARLGESLAELRRGLLAGDVPVGDYHFFTIHDPKVRLICAASFGERVLHHALMNRCEPVIERRLIHDTYACRKGKGRIVALERAQHFARRHGWYLKLDVRKYFDSIDQAALWRLLERVLKDRVVLDLLARIIGSYSTGPGRGVPIGNLTSQHFANLYLGELDHFVKHRQRVRGYVRYMDDFVLWAHDKAALKARAGEVNGFLRDELALECKPPQVNRVERGMPFLGCRLFPHRLRLDRSGRRRFVDRLRALEAAHAAGVISERELQQRATALVAYTETCGAAGFRRGVLAARDFGEELGAAATGPAAGSNRVLRGGSWNNNANNCRVANRNNNNPTNSNNNNGFRPVRSSETRCLQRQQDSDPVAVLSAPPNAGWQREQARPVPVGAVDAAPNAPGGPIFSSHSQWPR